MFCRPFDRLTRGAEFHFLRIKKALLRCGNTLCNYITLTPRLFSPFRFPRSIGVLNQYSHKGQGKQTSQNTGDVDVNTHQHLNAFTI